MFFEGLTRLAMGLAHLLLSEMILIGLQDRLVSEFKGTSPTTTQFAYCWPLSHRYSSAIGRWRVLSYGEANILPWFVHAALHWWGVGWFADCSSYRPTRIGAQEVLFIVYWKRWREQSWLSSCDDKMEGENLFQWHAFSARFSSPQSWSEFGEKITWSLSVICAWFPWSTFQRCSVFVCGHICFHHGEDSSNNHAIGFMNGGACFSSSCHSNAVVAFSLRAPLFMRTSTCSDHWRRPGVCGMLQP